MNHALQKRVKRVHLEIGTLHVEHMARAFYSAFVKSLGGALDVRWISLHRKRAHEPRHQVYPADRALQVSGSRQYAGRGHKIEMPDAVNFPRRVLSNMWIIMSLAE